MTEPKDIEAEVVDPGPKEEPKPKPVKELMTRPDGQIVTDTLSQQLSYAQTLITQGVVSSTFKTPQQVVIGMQYAKSLKIDTVPALKMMYVINGQPSLFGDGPLLMCRRTSLVDGFEEFFVNSEMKRISVANKNLKDEVYAAVCRVKRVGDKIWQEDYFTQDNLRTAGLDVNSYGKKKAVWEKFERLMMRYKSRSMALKSKFADVLHGIPIAEHDYHFSPDVPEVQVDANRKPKIRDINAEVAVL